MTIYIAGSITNDPDYKAKFDKAEQLLKGFGYVPLNPAWLPPEGFTYEAYLRMSMAMMLECEAVGFLPGWNLSNGARIECAKAEAAGKKIYYIYPREGVIERSLFQGG